MWYLVFRKSKSADVLIFHDKQSATKFARSAPTEKYNEQDFAISRARQLGYSYDVVLTVEERIEPTPYQKKQNKKHRRADKPKIAHRQITYRDYLKTPHWKATREKRLKVDGYKCQACGSTKGLQVHHLTYERIGREEMDDLITLCADCHKKVHDISQK